MNDLDLLREWPAERPTAETRERALAELEAFWYAPTQPVPARTKRRRLGARVAIALAVTASLVAGAVVWAQRETDRRFAAVSRIHLPNGTLSGAAAGRLPTTFLVVGSDSRAGLTDPAFGAPAGVPGERADTIMLLRIDHKGAQALWIPRDLFVDSTSPTKINAGLDHGPSALISALHDQLGVLVNHYVRVRFTGFQRIVDAFGGVSLTVPYPARDAYTGLDVASAGCTSFDGSRALQWARSRHLQYLVNGQWSNADPVPDIGRIGRQQRLLAAIAAKSRRTLAHHPHALLRVIDATLPNLQFDSGLDRAGMVIFAKTLLGLGPGSLATATVPWKTTPPRNGVAGLELNDPTVRGDALFAVTVQTGSLQTLLDDSVTQRSVDCR